MTFRHASTPPSDSYLALELYEGRSEIAPSMQQLNAPPDRGFWPPRRPVALGRAISGHADAPVHVADLRINPEWHEVMRGGRRIQLTRLEFRLLYLLAVNVDCVVPYEVLVKHAWGVEADSRAPALLKSPICRLRGKLGMRRPSRLTIDSVSRSGYRLAAGRGGSLPPLMATPHTWERN